MRRTGKALVIGMATALFLAPNNVFTKKNDAVLEKTRNRIERFLPLAEQSPINEKEIAQRLFDKMKEKGLNVQIIDAHKMDIPEAAKRLNVTIERMNEFVGIKNRHMLEYQQIAIDSIAAEIAKIGDEYSINLKIDEIVEMFGKIHGAMKGIRTYDGYIETDSWNEFFFGLQNGMIAHEIVFHTDVMKKISKIAGKETDNVFNALALEKLSQLLDRHSEEIVTIVELARADDFPGSIASALSALKHNIGDVFDEDPRGIIAYLKSAVANTESASLGSYTAILWTICDFDRATFNDVKDPAKFGLEKRHAVMLMMALQTELVSQLHSELAKKDMLQKMARIFDDFGIVHFGRYSPAILENAYLTATSPEYSVGYRNGYPIKKAMMIMAVDDWSGIFYDQFRYYEPLIAAGYNLIICEARDGTAVSERFFNKGLLKDALKKPDNSYYGLADYKYDLLMISGHGDPTSIQLYGSNELGVDAFGQNGYKEMSWAPMFNPNAVVILNACSNGAENKLWLSKKDNNMANMMHKLTGANVFAASGDGQIYDYKYDAYGAVKWVKYTPGTVYIPADR